MRALRPDDHPDGMPDRTAPRRYSNAQAHQHTGADAPRHAFIFTDWAIEGKLAAGSVRARAAAVPVGTGWRAAAPSRPPEYRCSLLEDAERDEEPERFDDVVR